MAHAFRPAAVIEAENAQRKVDRLRERWVSTRDTWFDGTAQSVDRRLANLDEIESFAKHIASRLNHSKVGNVCMAMLPQLRSDRLALEAKREQLTGAAWYPGSEEEARQFRLDPRDYSSREEWMDASNLSGYIQHQQELHPPHDYPVDESWRNPHAEPTPPTPGYKAPPPSRLVGQLQVAAAEFVDGQNTTDRHELLVRAQRLVAERTSSWEPEASREAVRAFTAAVDREIPYLQRQAAAPQPVCADFDDALMFS